MDKNESTVLKGVAILMMLFLHLFNQTDNIILCRNFIFLGEQPLVSILCRAANPVPIFLTLSGYGLFRVYLKGNYKPESRILKLYIPYWVTCAIFVPIGSVLVGPHRYPWQWKDILFNLTAWQTTWNGEIWFLFPYIVVALILSRWLFNLKTNSWLVLGVAFCFNLIGQFSVSSYGSSYLFAHHFLHLLIICVNILFPFLAGAFLAKHNVLE